MGASYSAGPIAPALASFVGLPLEEVRRRRLAFMRLIIAEHGGGTNAAFSMNRSQFTQIHGLKQAEDSYRLFKAFDPVGNGSFNSIDLFGAQALLSRDTLDARLRFILGLIDLNRDNRLNPSELSIVLRCVTRGVARLKKMEAPPLQSIQTLVSLEREREREKHALWSRVLPYFYVCNL